MDKVVERTVQSTQEQATASWIKYINQSRLDDFVDTLNRQDLNLEEALTELDELKKFVGDPAHILGSNLTKHGEIAEHMQVNFENARRLINGLNRNHTFEGVGRTAPEDYLRDGSPVQSKFYNGLKNIILGKHALLDHLKTYPDFIKSGGTYDIPKDQYDRMIELLDLYNNKDTRSKLSTSDFTLAKQIDEALNSYNLDPRKDIRPSVANYSDVQLHTAPQTIQDEETSIRETDKERRNGAYEEAKPSINEATKVTVVSAVAEGGIKFCLSFAKKRKEKPLSEFSADDWKQIGLDTGNSTIKGAVRGASVYALTNFTATPSNVASAYVTAAFGVVSQIKAFNTGKISKEDFIINCETVCLDVSVSAISSLAGQVIIPIPILGAVIGNVAGEFIYELCKNYGDEKTQKIIDGYTAEMKELNQQLDIQFAKVIGEVENSFGKFRNLEEMAFSEQLNDLEMIKLNEKAENTVALAAAVASATGAAPIPFADAPILIAEQVALMTKICNIYEINIGKDGLRMLATTALGVGGATVVGRTIAANLLKLIPIGGSFAGGAISAGTAGIVTFALGKAFITVCRLVKSGKLDETDILSSKGKTIITKEFKKNIKKKNKSQK